MKDVFCLKGFSEGLSPIVKISATVSIVFAVSGVLYLTVFIACLTGELVFYPVSIQDAILTARRWFLLIVLYLIISNRASLKQPRYFFIELPYLIKKYISKDKIFKLNIIIEKTTVFLSVIFLIAFVYLLPLVSKDIRSLLLCVILTVTVITIIIIIPYLIVINEYNSKNILIIIFLSCVYISYFDLTSRYFSNEQNIILTTTGTISGKIYLALDSGIFLEASNRIIFIKNSTISVILNP